MRREQKQQVDDFVQLLGQVHGEIKKALEAGKHAVALDLLAQCQDGAVALGELIEKTEGEGNPAISLLEEYCEQVYGIYMQIESGQEGINAGSLYRKLRKSLIGIENTIRNNIRVRYEAVFLPYKASMWDSLESVWQAADADPDWDAYVVPVPYYDRGADGSLETYHYEGNGFPPEVPVIYYDSYNLEARRPDVIYIHNPYDEGNYVTSVDPRYYSRELKKYTDCLVYIPYYSTAGGMAESQERCLGYYQVDYIVIQAEKYRKFFDPAIPDGKFLPLGSPKFDRIVRLCSGPRRPPEAWKQQMEGKKVYFYNTSINGMLADTEKFLKKMMYVFRCFQGREDVCLLWRPHPLLESTIDSLRKEWRPVYDRMKAFYLENKIGIYDDTPDITGTIALCDAYIGDGATSVTSLFGIAGKPVFILNNSLDIAPGEDDWRGSIVRGPAVDGQNAWIVTQGNKLYHSPNNDFHYRYYCDLSEYAAGSYYGRALEIGGKVYVCPQNAQDILIIGDKGIEKRVPLEHCMEQSGAFTMTWNAGRYLLLVPFKYPAIVRYDTVSGKIDYIRGYNDIFVKFVDGEWRVGGSCVWNRFLLIASPTDNRALAVNIDTAAVQTLAIGEENNCGCLYLVPEGGYNRTYGNAAEQEENRRDSVWLLPYSGSVITRWNPITGESQEYAGVPSAFQCKNRPHGHPCMDKPFSVAAFYGDEVFLPPYWGNMFMRLNRKTGEFAQWKPLFPTFEKGKNVYYDAWTVGTFTGKTDLAGNWLFFSACDNRLYEVDLGTGEYREREVTFDRSELEAHEPGFCENSEWMQYCCEENCFNSLKRLLDEDIAGRPFEQSRQLHAYEKVAVNNDGSCGRKVHRLMAEKVQGIRRRRQ